MISTDPQRDDALAPVLAGSAVQPEESLPLSQCGDEVYVRSDCAEFASAVGADVATQKSTAVAEHAGADHWGSSHVTACDDTPAAAPDLVEIELPRASSGRAV